MPVAVRRRPGWALARSSAAVALALAFLASALGPVPGFAKDPPPVHPTLRDFLPSGKYVLKSENRGPAAEKVYFSARAAAYLVRGSALGAPLLVRTGSASLETFPESDLLCREDGACDLRADVKTKELGKFRLEGLDIVIQVTGLSGRLVPSPPLLGWQRAEGLLAHTPEHARSAKSYRIDAACVDGIRACKRDIRVFVYFGSWCPACTLLLGRILRVDQELSGAEGSKVQFDYYGLPGAPRTWVEPEAVARDIDRLPTALVYVDTKFVRRIAGYELAKPEAAIAAALSGR